MDDTRANNELNKGWVYAGGLPFELTEGDIICVFSQYGDIPEFTLSRDKESGRSRGFCFIKYEDPRSCELAVDNFNETRIVGRKIKVSFANNLNAINQKITHPKHAEESRDSSLTSRYTIPGTTRKEESDRSDYNHVHSKHDNERHDQRTHSRTEYSNLRESSRTGYHSTRHDRRDENPDQDRKRYHSSRDKRDQRRSPSVDRDRHSSRRDRGDDEYKRRHHSGSRSGHTKELKSHSSESRKTDRRSQEKSRRSDHREGSYAKRSRLDHS